MLYEAIVKQNLLAETTSLFGRKYPQSSGAQNILRKSVTFVFKLCIRIPVPLATHRGQQARTSNTCVSTSLRIWGSVVHLLILFLKYHCSCVVWSQYALVYVPSCTVISKRFLLLRAVCVYVYVNASFCMKHSPLSQPVRERIWLFYRISLCLKMLLRDVQLERWGLHWSLQVSLFFSPQGRRSIVHIQLLQKSSPPLRSTLPVWLADSLFGETQLSWEIVIREGEGGLSGRWGQSCSALQISG